MTNKNEIVTGYKATDKKMQCRGYQFELGKWHIHDGEIAMCESGFHFCEYPSGPLSFYSDKETRIFKVEARGVIRGEGPGADLKHVAKEIRLTEEIFPDGYGNTGDRNTGDGNTGDRNTGDRNTGYGNTGDRNTGNWNTGNWNTGDWNTGDRNTGNWNTGNWNTGDGNTGDGNTGNGNATDKCAGHLCMKKQQIILFDEKVADESLICWSDVRELCEKLESDEPFDPSPFLKVPNATKKRIEDLHKAHIERRRKVKR